MIRSLLASWSLVLAVAASGLGQEWAEKMFDARQHDFGYVARASKTEVRIKFKNIYQETVHVSGVRTSCGCISASVNGDTLKTWETGEVVVELNTRSFNGKRSATTTVTFDKPFYAEVRIPIEAYIRTDVVFDPPALDLGAIDFGKGSDSKKVVVKYAGRNDWTITDVTSPNSSFEVELSKPTRANGNVEYNLTVRLKPDAPAGFIKDRLTFVTNDSSGQRIPLFIEGRVLPEITVSPASLLLGDLHPGQQVTKTIIVHGKSPFKVIACECADKCFTFKPGEAASMLHRIPVTYTAGDKAGRINQTIRIKTSLSTGAAATLQVTGSVVPQQAAKQ